MKKTRSKKSRDTSNLMFSSNMLSLIWRFLLISLILFHAYSKYAERNLHFQRGVANLLGQFSKKIKWSTLVKKVQNKNLNFRLTYRKNYSAH
jgi:hypothetical protein